MQKKNLFCKVLDNICIGIFIMALLFVVIGAYYQNKVINYEQVMGISETDLTKCIKVLYSDDNVYHYKYFCDTVITYQPTQNGNQTYLLNTQIKFIGSLPDKNQSFTVNYDRTNPQHAMLEIPNTYYADLSNALTKISASIICIFTALLVLKCLLFAYNKISQHLNCDQCCSWNLMSQAGEKPKGEILTPLQQIILYNYNPEDDV
jgi:hypothetical protein